MKAAGYMLLSLLLCGTTLQASHSLLEEIAEVPPAYLTKQLICLERHQDLRTPCWPQPSQQVTACLQE